MIKRASKCLVLIALGFGLQGSAIPTRPGVFLLPMNCTELLPEMGPFLGFFEAVALGNVSSDRNLSKRILKILALREKMLDLKDRGRDQNPVDQMIRKTLCFYREQKDPLRTVPYDDEDFLKFLRTNLGELEQKVDAAIFSWEMERFQRKEWEKQLEKNRAVLGKLREQAEIDADREFEKISKSAKQKITP